MKALKRVLTGALVLALSVSCFVGCGNKVDDKDEQGRTKISIGQWPSKDEKQVARWAEKKTKFMNDNPDVSIIEDKWAYDLKTFYAKAQSGQLPTYFSTAYTEIPAVIDSGYAVNIKSALDKYGYLERYNPKILELISRDDGVYMMPTDAYVLGLAYNVELFEAAGLMNEDGTPKQPKDWYELAEFAVKIKEATGVPGLVMNTSNNTGGWKFTPIAWSFGVDFMEQEEDGSWKATFNTPECVEALQYIKDLKWKYNVLPENTLIDNTECYKVFATDGAAMMIAAGDYPRKVSQYEMPTTKQGMMAFPAGPKRYVTLLGGSGYYVADGATDDQIDAAIRWHNFEHSWELSDDVKNSKIKDLDKKLEEGQMIGIKSLSVWNSNSEVLQFEHKLIDENNNTGNINHVKLYNDFVADCPADIQPEEPVCAQELYSILDTCIQKVLTDKNADCAKIIEKAAADFQADYLDNL